MAFKSRFRRPSTPAWPIAGSVEGIVPERSGIVTAAEFHDARRASDDRPATLRPLVNRLLAGEAPDTDSLSDPAAAELSDLLLERRGHPIALGR